MIKRLIFTLAMLCTMAVIQSKGQAIIAGQPCGAPGVSAIATNGQAVLCQGNPLVWTATGGSGSGGGGFGNQNNNNTGTGGYIDASAAPFNMQSGLLAIDCTTTSGQPTVVCTNTVCSSSMIGWLAHAENGSGGTSFFQGATYTFPLNAGAENTITACGGSGNHTFTLTQNASATVSSHLAFTIGPDDSAGNLALQNYAWNTPSNHPNCIPIRYPAGVFMIKSTGWIAAANITCGSALQANLEKNAEIEGWGGTATLLAPTQDWACGSSGTIQFPTPGSSHWRHLSLWGGGGAVPPGCNNNGTTYHSFQFGVDSLLLDADFLGWAADGSTSLRIPCIDDLGGGQAWVQVQIDGCGGQSTNGYSLNVTGSHAGLYDSFIGDCGTGGANQSCLFISVGAGGFFNLGDSGVGGQTVASVGAYQARGGGIGALTVGGSGQFIGGGQTTIGSIAVFAGSQIILSPTDNGTLTGLAPTITGTIWGTSPTITLDAGNSTGQFGSVTVTEGTTPPASGTFILTFNYTLSTSGNPPVCSLNFKNGTGSWNARVSAVLTTPTTTAMTWTIDNNAIALTAASTYGITWTCVPR